jgi:plasmid replication initiation protein
MNKASVWAKLNLADKQALKELYNHLDTFYDHYNTIVGGTNAEAVKSDLREMANICTDMAARCNNLIKDLK